jgi:hypothetical protein
MKIVITIFVMFFCSFIQNHSVAQTHKKGNFTYKVLDSSLVNAEATLWNGKADCWTIDLSKKDTTKISKSDSMKIFFSEIKRGERR